MGDLSGGEPRIELLNAFARALPGKRKIRSLERAKPFGLSAGIAGSFCAQGGIIFVLLPMILDMNTLSSVDYFDHEADIGIIGRGDTLERAFESAAVAVFAIMTDLALVSPEKSVQIEFEESDVELALVTWLNALISNARIQSLVFCRFRIERKEMRWVGKAWGESWKEESVRGTEVKGATLTMLCVEHKAAGWEARCVVDV